MDFTNPSEFTDRIVDALASHAWAAAKYVIPNYWPYLLVFFTIIVGGVILQIIMLREGGHENRLPSEFNSLVGSLTYWSFFWGQAVVMYKIFGPQVVDDIWFAAFGILAYPGTKLFLRSIGFWYR